MNHIIEKIISLKKLRCFVAGVRNILSRNINLMNSLIIVTKVSNNNILSTIFRNNNLIIAVRNVLFKEIVENLKDLINNFRQCN